MARSPLNTIDCNLKGALNNEIFLKRILNKYGIQNKIDTTLSMYSSNKVEIDPEKYSTKLKLFDSVKTPKINI
jgi:hypothetical protein